MTDLTEDVRARVASALTSRQKAGIDYRGMQVSADELLALCDAAEEHDREPLPSDGPDYHHDHLAWQARQGSDPYEYGRSDPESDRVEVWGELKYAQKWAAELGGTVLRRTRAVAAGEWEAL